MIEAEEPVCGLLMAGGRSRRMGGGDKGLRTLAGRSLLAHVIERAEPQADCLVLNANGDPARFAAFGLPVVPDGIEGFAGPLAGVLTGMTWVSRNMPQCRWLATFACDAPFFPRDLVPCLRQVLNREEADMACAASGGRRHPVFGLWPVSLREDLHKALVAEEIRKVEAWTGRYRVATAAFPPVESAEGAFDPFFNANAPEDLAAAERIAASGGSGATGG